MVIKLYGIIFILKKGFESSVISYGDKTLWVASMPKDAFESSVISYGDKTSIHPTGSLFQFESSVISYGDKTWEVEYLMNARLFGGYKPKVEYGTAAI